MSGDHWEGGGLSPEEAERLASKFKPIWETNPEPTSGPSAVEASSIPSPAVTEGAESSNPSTPAQPSARKETLLGVPAPQSIEPSPHHAKARAETIAVAPPPARTDAVEFLPSIMIGDGVTEAPRLQAEASFDSAPEVPVVAKGGFGKGLYVGLGIGAASVIAAVLIASSGTESKPRNANPPPLAATAPEASKPHPPVTEPAEEAPVPPTAASAETPSAPVIPAALPSVPEPAKVVAPEKPVAPPKADPPSPPRPATPPTSAQKPAPKSAPKSSQPAAAPAKPRNPSSGSAIVRDAPF